MALNKVTIRNQSYAPPKLYSIKYLYDINTKVILPSRLGQKDTPTASLQRGKPAWRVYPDYDTKKSAGEV